MALQGVNLPNAHMEWIGGKAMYLYSTHKGERAWRKEKIRSLNDQGDRPVAHIVATNRGCAKKTRPQKARADWRDRHTSVEAPDI